MTTIRTRRVIALVACAASVAGCTSRQVEKAFDDSAPAAPQAPANVDVGSNVESLGAAPASSAGEPSGNFRFLCTVSHLSYDDPIVAPGRPASAHLHMFFGNAAADANSSYDSLRASGDGSCAGGPLNRSAYWVPAMLNGAGQVIIADLAVVYYKGSFDGVAGIAQIPTMPAGLKMIAGYNMNDPSAPTYMHWYCAGQGPQARDAPLAATPVACPAGDQLIARQEFPPCWDGQNLDSADHRSHMSYVVYDPNTGQGSCPATHPVHVPEYTISVFWRSDGDIPSWKLSSDTMPGMTHAPGSTFHSDWFGAWDPTIQAVWTRECINMLRNCNAGELGDGRKLSDPRPYTGAMVVAPPAR
jgi:Domain of unknown function (DUF1996)